ncbi:hypothetical protein ACE10Z_15285 [Bradyrhizobium sp. Pha-3]|uniref:hypothetical protein n=1 Tax=Bradyrhizobium sp. Pha-3 TaxID=208375 RepID=UPI0035D48520
MNRKIDATRRGGLSVSSSERRAEATQAIPRDHARVTAVSLLGDGVLGPLSACGEPGAMNLSGLSLRDLEYVVAIAVIPRSPSFSAKA